MEFCLQIHPKERKTPGELLQLPLFEDLLLNDTIDMKENLHKNLLQRKIDELYYLWQLAGGDITIELKKQGLIRSRPPILPIPK